MKSVPATYHSQRKPHIEIIITFIINKEILTREPLRKLIHKKNILKPSDKVFAFLHFALQIAGAAAPLWRRETAASKANAAVVPSSSESPQYLMSDLTGVLTTTTKRMIKKKRNIKKNDVPLHHTTGRRRKMIQKKKSKQANRHT